MSTPDVRVRLTPEGIKEVIFALRAVQDAADKANRGAGSGISLVKRAVLDLKSLLPSLGLAAVVGGFIGMSKEALNAADATGKLQQKVGGTVQDISALTLAFRTNESDQDGLQVALQKTAKLQADVLAGGKEAAKGIAAIGVSAKEFTALNTPRALELLATGLAKIPPSGQRAAASQALFGKNSAELIVALNAVGEKGIDPFIEKARELGVLIDDDLATAAARAKDSLGEIKIAAQGLATQFVSGLAPSVSEAMGQFKKAVTGDGINGMETFGRAVGIIVKTIVASFVTMGKIIGAFFATQVSLAVGFFDTLKALAHFDFKGVAAVARRVASEQAAILNGLAEDLRDVAAKPPPLPPRSTAGQQGSVLPPVDPEAKKTAAARAAFILAALENELKILKEKGRAALDANQALYDQGLISLSAYYAKRREILIAEQEKELQVLRAQRAALSTQLGGLTGADDTESDRINVRKQIAAVDAQIRVQEISGQRELANLDAERVTSQKALDRERIASNVNLLTAENNRHAVFVANLAEEIRQLRELGIRAGESADEIESKIGRLTKARTAQFNLDEVGRSANAALAAFARDAELIHRDQEAGLLSQFEGEQRLIDLERKRLDTLKQMAEALQKAAAATGDPEQIARAQEFADTVGQIELNYRTATDSILKFKIAGREAAQEGISALLQNIDKIKSVGDAFEQLANTIAQALLKIAADIIAQRVVIASLGALGVLPTANTGGQVQGHAEGDLVRGRKLPIPGPDNVPILAQHGEFIVRKAIVQRPGALRALRAFNRGMLSVLPRFATGGLVGGPKAPSGGGGFADRRPQMNFYLSTDKKGNVSQQNLQQITAAGARALRQADARDN